MRSMVFNLHKKQIETKSKQIFHFPDETFKTSKFCRMEIDNSIRLLKIGKDICTYFLYDNQRKGYTN